MLNYWKLSILWPALALLLQLAAASSLLAAEKSLENRFDPALMTGVESCRECHESAAATWEQTPHATSFSDLHQRSLATDIADLLGIQAVDIRRSASCARCHFSEEKIHSVIQVETAVSCESCHGPAADWIDVHNKGSVSPSSRIQQAAQAGMIHPANLHDIGKRCFDCHVIDSEPLVNVAGHPAISEGFELYSWSQGQMRHNFLAAKPDRKVKRESNSLQPVSQGHKRMLFLTGKLLHLSATLRAISKAGDSPVDIDGAYVKLPDGNYTFAVQHARQATKLIEEIRDLNARAPNSSYAEALKILAEVRFETGNSENILAASEQIGNLAEQLSRKHSGEEFAALDPILAELPTR